jgi:hypothetical protein
MAEEKPKYVRKKCEHHRYSFQCKDCKGVSICPHDRKRNNCKECNGNGLCPHQRIKQNCVECDGASICEHKKRRSRCIECKGGSICPHEKLRARCKDCNGSEMCEHQRRRQICVECNGSQVCPHQLRKSRCQECNGTEICAHKNSKYNCVECNGKNVCEHKRLQYQCTECNGRLICEHGTRKSICKECDGAYICEHKMQRNQCIICTPSSACQHCQAISILGSHWKPLCFRCYCVLHPDAVIPRKFKLKENYVVEALKTRFQETVTMVIDKKVEGGCSRRRPDVSIDFGSHCLMIEIDEHHHASYACEEKRMMDLFEDVGFRKIVFLRFNPDSYRQNGKVYRSPFGYTPTGILKLHQEEFDRRIAELVTRIRVHSHEPAELFTVEFLFYN